MLSSFVLGHSSLVAAALAVLLAGVGVVAWVVNSRSNGNLLPSAPKPGEPPANLQGPAWFRDMTAACGVDFTYRNDEDANHYAILESLGGGVALFDFDGDGLLDIFVAGGGYFGGPDKKQIKGHPCKLYRNLDGWKFQDVTAQVGLVLPDFYTHGVAVADYDRDGHPDLLVTGYGRIVMYHNEADGKGGRRLVDVTGKLGLHDDLWSTSAGWADLDGDGYPDLYVCHYLDWSFANHPVCESFKPGEPRDVCPPQRFSPQVHALFRNEKGKSFRNVSAEHGFRAAGCGLGVVLLDVNDDRRPDIYVANDATDKFLFLNRGSRLEERAMHAGVALDENGLVASSMGVDAADYDGSGRPSLLVTNFQNQLHGLYRNLGQERFQHQSRPAGIAAIGQQYVGFGTNFVDLDNDGWEDLVIVNGHVLRHPIFGSTFKQKPVLMRNVAFEGRRFFQEITVQGGLYFQTPAIGRGSAVGDLDNDGWPDLVVSHTNSPVAVLRNQAAAATAKPARWLGLRLIGKDHRDIVGSTIILEANGRKLTRFTKGGGSYLSAGDPRILFGLGDLEQVDRVTVKWSWGATQTWTGLAPNGYWDLHEGEAMPRRR